MSHASRALSNGSCQRDSRRQADQSLYGVAGVRTANGLGPLPTLPFASPFSPPTTLPPLPPLQTSGTAAKLQTRRHSAPIASSPSKRHAASPFPPPTNPLPPIPSEDGLDYPGWPASLSAISQGLAQVPMGVSRGTGRRAPPAWPSSRAPVREEEEEEEEWRHPYAIASSPTRDYQWDKARGDLDSENARRRSVDLASGSRGGISPLYLPQLHLLPPIGTTGTPRRGQNMGQDEVSAGHGGRRSSLVSD